ncbi:MAG TPA: ATP-dependent acyl-CoA ligase [Burkholderiales bacterium]|jgi:crotonobetaine/carnitine-CoA ligase
MLRRAAGRFGDHPLLSMGDAHWRHRDAAQAAARRAAALRAAGISRGDRVAIMCGNRAELLEVFLACGWLGAIAVPINTASMAPQIEYYLSNSGAKLLVIEARFVERLGSASIRTWVIGESYPPPGEAVVPEEVQPGETLAILYTSGTTGPAKGVTCPHAQYYWWGLNTASILGVGSDDVLCTTLPLFHINALNTFAQAALTGCSVVFESQFSASRFWSTVQKRRATVIYLLGAMVPILLAQPPSPAERSHRVRIGLGPGVPASALQTFHERTGITLLEGYGSTETNFVIATAADSARRGVMGWIRPGFQARVVDEHDVELPAGEAGELALRADEPFAFATGYFGMPEKTVEAWRNLWFHTGDRVVREADGAFRFVDRIKDAIRRRGENVSSYEVEQVLLSHPHVAAAAVYPVRSELAEDEVMAALVAATGRDIDCAALASFCESRLPKFAIPRYIDVLPDLPRTENGKVQKYKLRSRGVSAATWDRLKKEPGPGPHLPMGT